MSGSRASTVASAAAPYYGGGFTKVEPYAFWSNVAPSLVSGIDIRVKEIDYETLRRLYNQWRQTSACYYGDYYPLTAYSQSPKDWIAWQFKPVKTFPETATSRVPISSIPAAG